MIEPYWLTLGKRELGQYEIPGPQSNQRIIEYGQYAQFKVSSDQIPWCGNYACFCLEQAGILSPRSARARDFLHWGIKLDVPRIGCICVLTRGLNKDEGHVGFFVGQDPTHVHILGGNQHDCVCFQKFPKVMVIGFRWPEDGDKLLCEPGDKL